MMADRTRNKRRSTLELPIAPMIDVVFLLLIYFIVSSTLKPQETDIAFSLPGTVIQSEPLEFADEPIVQINEQGSAILNDFVFDSPDDKVYQQLAATLSRYHQASRSNLSQSRVTLAPYDRAPHQAVVKVMDACALAGIEIVTFATD